MKIITFDTPLQILKNPSHLLLEILTIDSIAHVDAILFIILVNIIEPGFRPLILANLNSLWCFTRSYSSYEGQTVATCSVALFPPFKI